MYSPDENLIRRLPLPPAQLVRHAANAKTPLERCYAGYYVCEAAIKLLGCVAVSTFSGRPVTKPELEAKFQKLALPSMGDWRDLVHSLIEELQDEDGFAALAAFNTKKETADLPRLAAFDAVLRKMLDEGGGSKAAVRLDQFTLRIVRFRNKYIGHGRLDSHPIDVLEQFAAASLPGMCELLARFDLLAGRTLEYIDEIKKMPGDRFAVHRRLLQGESPRRLDALNVSDAAALHPEQIYFATNDGTLSPAHPLLLYQPADDEVMFLNARRGETKTEYLGYLSGKSIRRPDLDGDQRGLLGRILGKAIDPSAIVRPESDDAPVPEGPSQWLGEFQLLSRLGRGGMGIVYRARQATLGREVALKKLLNPGDEKAEARFAREIRALGKVDHPNLVRVYCSGVSGEDWYYAMELVEGATLANVIETLQSKGSSASGIAAETWRASLSTAYEATRRAEKPIGDTPANRGRESVGVVQAQTGHISRVNAVSQIVELIRQAALAAHSLHENGILHRDIKPGNIMVTADGSKALLLDLGLAQLADDEHGSLTKTREFLGTLRYMSPEQLMDARKVDRRTDVYSLGATLWELLTLKPLFDASEETPKPEVIRRIQFDEPASLRRHDKQLPRDLEAVVLKSLEKNPAKRYQTAEEFADDLGRWQRGERVGAGERPLWHIAGRFISKRATRVKQGLMLILTVFLIGVVVLQSRQSVSNNRPHDPGIQSPPSNSKERAALQPVDPPSDSLPAPPSEPIAEQPPRPVSSLAGEMREFAKVVKTALEKRNETAIALAPIEGGQLEECTPESAIARALTLELEAAGIRIQSQAVATVHCSFSPAIDEKANTLAVQLNLHITDRRDGTTIVPRTVRSVLGIPAAVLLARTIGWTTIKGTTEEKRLELLKDQFGRSNGAPAAAGSSMVVTRAQTPYGVEIVTGEGDALHAPPIQWVDGFAFVNVPRGKPFRVRVTNQSPYDAAVALTVNGISMFEFSDDPKLRKAGAFIVPAASRAAIPGWFRDPRRSDDFAIGLTTGSPSERWLLTDRGLSITAVFAAAWAENGPRPEDEPNIRDATGAGPTVSTSYSMLKRIIGIPRAIISIHVGESPSTPTPSSAAPDPMQGLRVSIVEPNSPASKLGLKPGMLVISLDGKPTTTFKSWIDALTVGDHVLEIWDPDQNKRRELKFTKAEAPLGLSFVKPGDDI